jgi:predicted  nucleic acid-binding Zn-ribbon protein
MAGSAGANVVIKLDITGDKGVKQRLDWVTLKFEAMEKAMGAHDKKVEKLSGSHDKLSASILQTHEDLDKLNAGALTKFGDHFDKLGPQMTSASKDMKSMRSSFRGMREDLTKLNNHGLSTFGDRLTKHMPQVQDANKDFAKMSKSINAMSKDLSSANDELKKMGGISKSLRKNHLIPLDKELQQKKKDFDALNKSVGESNKGMQTLQKSTSKLHGDGKDENPFKKMFKGAFKFIKAFGAEFAVMSGIVGAFRGALWAGELAAKGFQLALQGVGIAAGAAVAGISTALGAVRELSVAKMTPLMEMAGQKATGNTNIASQASAVMGDERLGMFDSKTLGSLTTEAARQGQAGKGQLGSMFASLGDFAITAADPNKALSDLATGFMTAQKAGKFTQDTFDQISKASPEMVKGFEEMYGGADGLKSALSSGKVSADDFLRALDDGRLKSMEPFKDSLDNVNDTLIGRFKGNLAGVKEQLTLLGGPLVDALKGPLEKLSSAIKIFVMQVGPAVQSTFGQIFNQLGSGNGITRFSDALARLTVTNLPKLIGMGTKLRDWFRDMKERFSGVGDWLRKMSTSWDTIFAKILKPIGTEVWDTIVHAIKAFNETIDHTGSYGDSFAQRLHSIFEAVRDLIDGFAKMKQVLAPIIDSFTRLLSIASKLFSVFSGDGWGSMFAALGMTGMMMGRKGGKGNKYSKGYSAAMARAGGGAGAAGMGMGMGGMPMGRTSRMGGFATMMMNPFMMPFAGGMPFAGRAPQGPVDPNGFRGLMAQQQAINNGSFIGPLAPGQKVGTSPVVAASKKFFTTGAKTFFSKSSMKAFGANALPVLASIAGGMISGNADQTDETAQSWGGALSGAGSGAMIGGTIGSVIPGVGTAVGAAVGGVIGGVAGFISGGDDARKARAAEVKQMSDDAYQRAMDERKKNDVDSLTGAKRSAEDTYNLASAASARGFHFSLDSSKNGSLYSAVDQLDTMFREASTNGAITPEMDRLAQILSKGSGEFGAGGAAGAQEWVDSFGDMAQKLPETMAGQADALRALSAAGDIVPEDLTPRIDAAVASYDSFNELVKEFPDLTEEAAAAIASNLSGAVTELGTEGNYLGRNLMALNETMGLSQDGAEAFAQSLGIDLNTSLLSMTDIISALGYTLDDAANQAIAAGNIFRDLFTGVEERAKTTQLEEEFQAAGKAFGDDPSTDASVITGNADRFAQSIVSQELSRLQSGEITFDEFRFESLRRLGGAQAKTEEHFGKNDTHTTALQQVVDEISNTLGNLDFADRLRYDPKFATTLGDQMKNTAKYLSDGGKKVPTESDIQRVTDNYVAQLKSQGIEVDPTTIETMLTGEIDKMSGLGEDWAKTMRAILDKVSISVEGNIQINADGKISTVDLKGSVGSGGSSSTTSGDGNGRTGTRKYTDTTSPRRNRVGDTASSRLARTLARHAAFDGMVSGSRSITSSFRTTNLGSPSSDHLAGAAFDLVGDNLGQYAQNVTAAGGFAEFHGSAGSRHLHVVPPQGDTASPMAGGVASGGGGTVTINAPINITARDGQSAREIANIVMAELASRERSARERA